MYVNNFLKITHIHVYLLLILSKSRLCCEFVLSCFHFWKSERKGKGKEKFRKESVSSRSCWRTLQYGYANSFCHRRLVLGNSWIREKRWTGCIQEREMAFLDLAIIIIKQFKLLTTSFSCSNLIIAINKLRNTNYTWSFTSIIFFY